MIKKSKIVNLFRMNNVFVYLILSSIMFVSCNNSPEKIDNGGYSGNDISEIASIVRNKETKATQLNIKTQGKWTLYAGTTVGNINFEKPVAEGEGSGTFPINVSDYVRSYFQLVTDNGQGILSERQLPMLGGYNFRDLGGIKTTENRYVKWGKIFRSDDLQNLSEADLSYLSSIPLISIVDFRSDEEVAKGPNKLPSSVVKEYSFAISPGNLMNTKNLMEMTPEQLDSAMMDINVLLVSDSESVIQYKKLFGLLQNEKDVPLMFHCSAGKDRTGMGTALILFSLGVSEDVILKDYLSSNIYLSEKYANYLAKYPNLKPLFEVKPEFLKAGIERIKKDHGSVKSYLINILNVDIEKMKDLYLY